jgi:alpha-beta hydrolase superfamily lysophospholipase
VPEPIYFQAAIVIGNRVDFANPKTAPPFWIPGEKDLTMTPSMARAICRKHRQSRAPVEPIEFPAQKHHLIAEPGCEEVVGATLAWIEKSTR